MTIENNMTIRLGTPEDLDALVQLYDAVCDHMAAAVNYTGWKKGAYPARQDAEEGIRDGILYLAEEDGEAMGSFILSHRQEDAYAGVKWQGGSAGAGRLNHLYLHGRSPKAGTGHRAGDAPLRGQPRIGAGCKGHPAGRI